MTYKKASTCLAEAKFIFFGFTYLSISFFVPLLNIIINLHLIT
jgi:hypothetical protein